MSWTDATGRRLPQSFEKRFTVGPLDRERPDPHAWSVASPSAGSADALVVRFGEPLDRALLDRTIGVVGPDSRRVTGRISVPDGEREWRFVPSAPWQSGRHTIEIDPALEDTAGNNLHALFDVDLTRDSAETTHRLAPRVLTFESRAS